MEHGEKILRFPWRLSAGFWQEMSSSGRLGKVFSLGLRNGEGGASWLGPRSPSRGRVRNQGLPPLGCLSKGGLSHHGSPLKPAKRSKGLRKNLKTCILLYLRLSPAIVDRGIIPSS